jgi:hypothetical protein
MTVESLTTSLKGELLFETFKRLILKVTETINAIVVDSGNFKPK